MRNANGFFYDDTTGHMFSEDGVEYDAFQFRPPLLECNPAQHPTRDTAGKVARLLSGRLNLGFTVPDVPPNYSAGYQVAIGEVRFSAGLLAMDILRYGLPKAAEHLKAELIANGVMNGDGSLVIRKVGP